MDISSRTIAARYANLPAWRRPLRIEFTGALYHITSRGDRWETIFEDDKDREAFLNVLAETVERYNRVCHAYCLITDHYHLLVETAEGNLSQGMRHLNGVYTQASNRRHRCIGHLFRGRFKGIPVDRDACLPELGRYIVSSPARAGMADAPEQWHRSNYRAMIGMVPASNRLAVDGLPSPFGSDREEARRCYRSFVPEGAGQGIWEGLRQQIYPGDEAFVERMQAKARGRGDTLSVPRAQRRPSPPSLAEFAAHPDGRNAAIAAAYATGAYSYREIAEHFGVHLATVGRIVRREMQRCEK